MTWPQNKQKPWGSLPNRSVIFFNSVQTANRETVMLDLKILRNIPRLQETQKLCFYIEKCVKTKGKSKKCRWWKMAKMKVDCNVNKLENVILSSFAWLHLKFKKTVLWQNSFRKGIRLLIGGHLLYKEAFPIISAFTTVSTNKYDIVCRFRRQDKIMMMKPWRKRSMNMMRHWNGAWWWFLFCLSLHYLFQQRSPFATFILFPTQYFGSTAFFLTEVWWCFL